MTTEKKWKCYVKTKKGEKPKTWEHVDNLLSFTNFLDRTFPEWEWFTVYSRNDNKILAQYQKENKPTRKNP